MQSMDAILKGDKPEPAVEQPKVEAPVTEAKAETPEPQETETQRAERERDEKGRFAKKSDAQTPATPDAPKAPEAPKVEKKAEPTPAEKKQPESTQDAELPPKGHVPVKVALEERRKRQELERQLAAMRAQPVQAQTNQEQQQGAPDIGQVEENLKANLSYAFAKRQYPDFEEVMQEWPLLIHDQPALYRQAIADEMPAEWAYKYVKRHRLMQEIGTDPEAWREAQRSALRSELEQEFAQKSPQVAPKTPPAPVPPPSLANAKSATGSISSSAPTYSGPTPFQSIIRR